MKPDRYIKGTWSGDEVFLTIFRWEEIQSQYTMYRYFDVGRSYWTECTMGKTLDEYIPEVQKYNTISHTKELTKDEFFLELL
jgi:hypothetical protein